MRLLVHDQILLFALVNLISEQIMSKQEILNLGQKLEGWLGFQPLWQRLVSFYGIIRMKVPLVGFPVHAK